MADNQLLLEEEDGVGGDDIFVYTGGGQRVPINIRRVRIAENVDTIPAGVFEEFQQLIEVEGHNKIKKIEEFAFICCPSLRRVTKMTGLIEIEADAFSNCWSLSELDFDKLEIIGHHAFAFCESLRSINMSSVKKVKSCAFESCTALTDVSFGTGSADEKAFFKCTALRRIVIPLTNDGSGRNFFIDDEAFDGCHNLSRLDIIDGGMLKTISSLHLESWRIKMEEEIHRINQTLPKIPATEKTEAIKEWKRTVMHKMNVYTTKHLMLLHKVKMLLELALWKIKLEEKKCTLGVITNGPDTNVESAARKECRVTCGASIVIKNVLLSLHWVRAINQRVYSLFYPNLRFFVSYGTVNRATKDPTHNNIISLLLSKRITKPRDKK